jgi:hypothetical protein
MDGALIRFIDPGQEVQERRLSRSGRSHQRQEFTVGDV